MRLSDLRPHGFGHLGVHVKNQVEYTLSAFEQNPIKGVVAKGVPNILRRFRDKFLVVAIPAAVFYGFYDFGSRAQLAMDRKNPADFENDV
ncbi:cytochrome b-c1 complex subunit 8-like [Clavelina lepadiformis]|uniref:Cytochrome b-c1 complex subunit 8 n=1 Tax=Clavelina lepadiformis TaxID=159417 RepID=A0ABP0FYA0_CLALP